MIPSIPTVLERPLVPPLVLLLSVSRETEVGRIRLGGRWLRSDRYESERGRK
ncbi:hypothetical protein BDZ91DRAFT_740095 [Kalaharituber pfeilii]|nr:hypothetical protein BDZ91DRAFT_740095 [Kalaharituber pfeilii]